MQVVTPAKAIGVPGGGGSDSAVNSQIHAAAQDPQLYPSVQHSFFALPVVQLNATSPLLCAVCYEGIQPEGNAKATPPPAPQPPFLAVPFQICCGCRGAA
jgi:hypothetical protein